ncbi:MAG: helix-turn-helix domain-containing protein [Clostridia bacterium]|nr:helix-turn-helix domain-containing protein [Clostridia bacterium]
MDKIGRKIQELRKSKSLTQEQLAEKTGVSRQTIYKWESDYVQPNNENIVKLCEVLAVDKKYFFEISAEDTAANNAPANPNITKKKRSIIAVIISGILTLFSAIVTICVGLTTYQPSQNAMWATTSSLNITYFYISLVFTILFFCFTALCMVGLFRNKTK